MSLHDRGIRGRRVCVAIIITHTNNISVSSCRIIINRISLIIGGNIRSRRIVRRVIRIMSMHGVRINIGINISRRSSSRRRVRISIRVWCRLIGSVIGVRRKLISIRIVIRTRIRVRLSVCTRDRITCSYLP